MSNSRSVVSRVRVVRLRQSDIARALRAAQHAGLEIAGYEIDPATGRIVVTIRDGGSADEVRAPLDKWIADHAGEA